MLRFLPFAAVALVGQLSAAWPPGPVDRGAFVASTVLLFVSTVLVATSKFALPHTWLLRSAVYMSSVAFLMLATGGVDSGAGGLLLIPVFGVALYGELWESAVVVAFVLSAQIAVSQAAGGALAASTPRRLFLTFAIAAMVSVAIHSLRWRLEASNERTKRLLRHEEALNAAARQLVMLSEPPQITALGASLAAQLAQPTGSEEPSTAYFRIQDGFVVVDESTAEPDSQGGGSSARTVECWPLAEHPGLRDAVATLQPVAAAIDPEQAGPALRARLAETGITHGAWVPVCPDGHLHGVLAIAGRGSRVSPGSVERCVALSHLLELALSNWAAHEKLREQATAEERRRIARDLHDGLAHELAFIASKTRGSAGPGGRTESEVRALAGAADRALDEARRAITVLSVARPQSLDDAIAQTAEDLASRFGMAIDLQLADGDGFELPGEVTENLLRILREAMTNAATHGAAEHVRITLEGAQAERLGLRIEDDGCGFDQHAGRPSNGFGLQSMRERAESVGAVLSVDSAPRQGTRVEVAFS